MSHSNRLRSDSVLQGCLQSSGYTPPDPPTGYVGLKLRMTAMVLWGYSAATACVVASKPLVTLASEYHHSTLNGTSTCSSHNDTAQYETYVTGRRNLDVHIVTSLSLVASTVVHTQFKTVVIKCTWMERWTRFNVWYQCLIQQIIRKSYTQQ